MRGKEKQRHLETGEAPPRPCHSNQPYLCPVWPNHRAPGAEGTGQDREAGPGPQEFTGSEQARADLRVGHSLGVK